MAEQSRVGLTSIDATVTGPTGVRVTLEFLVDSGAKYTLLPFEVWRQLGLAPTRSMRFQLADLTTIERAISECYIELAEIDGERPRGHTTVMLGESRDVALLGVVTLEGFGLILNPLERSLHRMMQAPLMRTIA